MSGILLQIFTILSKNPVFNQKNQKVLKRITKFHQKSRIYSFIKSHIKITLVYVLIINFHRKTTTVWLLQNEKKKKMIIEKGTY